MSKRKPFAPVRGKVYDNHGGGTFLCTGQAWKTDQGWFASFRNVKSGWTFQARGICVYPDGTIDWDYSVHGRFIVKEQKDEEVQA